MKSRNHVRVVSEQPEDFSQADSVAEQVQTPQKTIVQGSSDNDTAVSQEETDIQNIEDSPEASEEVTPVPESNNAGDDSDEEADDGSPQAGSPVDQITLSWVSPGADADVISYKVFAREDSLYLAAPVVLVGQVSVSENGFNISAPSLTLKLADSPELQAMKGAKTCFKIVAQNSFGASLASDLNCIELR